MIATPLQLLQPTAAQPISATKALTASVIMHSTKYLIAAMGDDCN
jgi:hypothetical protein